MNLVAWEKNSDYPMSFTTCRTCGQEGLMKQSWDLRGSLCVDAKACLARMVRQHTLPSIHGDDEVFEVNEHDVEIVKAAMVAEVAIIDSESSDKLQWFVCEKCNINWSRPSTRGRPPKVCPDCR